MDSKHEKPRIFLRLMFFLLLQIFFFLPNFLFCFGVRCNDCCKQICFAFSLVVNLLVQRILVCTGIRICNQIPCRDLFDFLVWPNYNEQTSDKEFQISEQKGQFLLSACFSYLLQFTVVFRQRHAYGLHSLCSVPISGFSGVEVVGLGIGQLCETWGHEDRLTTHRGREQEKQQEEKTQTQVTERPQLSSRHAASQSLVFNHRRPLT